MVWRSLALAGGLGPPAVMWAEFLWFGSRTPGYNFLLRAASELGEIGARGRELFTLGFFHLAGALTVLLGLALLRLLPRGPAAALGALLVAVEGAALFATGLFPMDPASPVRTAEHQLVSSVSFFAAALAPIPVGLALRGPRPRFAAASLALGSLLTAWFAGGLALRAAVAFPEGLFQRPFGLGLTAWFLLTSITLFRTSG